MSDTNYTWHQTGNFAKFRIQESKYGLFISIQEDGTQLLTALTHEVCLRMTPFHQECNAPDYDGRYDLSTHAANKVVDL